MKILVEKYFFVIFILLIQIFTSCLGNATFTKDEIRFMKPFFKENIIIFKSNIGQIDTITFLKYNVDTLKFRNIEQGFYNENRLFVGYKLSKGSYHKITLNSIYETPEKFLSFTKAKNSHSSKEISFLGLIFDENFMDKNISNIDKIIFNKQNAIYSGININDGIKSFTFNFEKGIISYVDKKGNIFTRIN